MTPRATTPPATTPVFSFDELSASHCGVVNAALLQKHLADWTKAGPREEHESRLRASQAITNAWQNRASSLELNNLHLTSLPAVIGDMTHLERLTLRNNLLEQIPEALGTLHRLHDLDLAENPLTCLDETFLPPNLRELNLDRTRLRSFPQPLVDRAAGGLKIRFRETLASGPAIERAAIRLINVGAYNRDIFETGPQRLQQFYRRGASSKSLPDNVIRAAATEKTPRIGWPSSDLPPQNDATPARESLSEIAANAHPLKIPPTLSFPLPASKNIPIKTTPPAHRGTPFKASISFEGMSISAANSPATSALPQTLLCQPLKEWVAKSRDEETRNNRTKAAKTIQNCINRKDEQLNLAGLQLDSLPALLWEQTQLTKLHLDNNLLGPLPEAIGRLVNLTHLTLAGNQIASLPNAITNLKNLRVLNLSNNFFIAPPEQLQQLDNLEYLYLHNNPMPEDVPAVLGQLPKRCHIFIGNPQKPDTSAFERHTFPNHPNSPLILVLH